MLLQETRPVDLNAISADVGILTAGRIENAGGTAGILLSGTKPGGWVRGLDLTATGSEPFLFHPALELLADGSADFSGEVSSEFFSGTGAWFQNSLDVGGEPDTTQVRTSIVAAGVIWRKFNDGNPAVRMDLVNNSLFRIDAPDGAVIEVGDGSANRAQLAKVVVSTSAASGDYPEGTIWLRV